MSPKILVFDIETAPVLADVWALHDQNVGLNQIQRDWYVIAWGAKWFGSKTVMYADQRGAKDPENDKAILLPIWKLLDEADIVITQNGKNFDSKKLNARFIIHGMKPPSPYRHLDTLILAKKVAAFTSNKLEYLTNTLCTKYKKLDHKEFPGHVLWRECLRGNRKAWECMKRYNIHDVFSTEELYTKLQAWDRSIDFSVYSDSVVASCACGCREFEKRGFAFTSTGKFQRYSCKSCGKFSASRTNLLSVDCRKRLHKSAGGR